MSQNIDIRNVAGELEELPETMKDQYTYDYGDVIADLLSELHDPAVVMGVKPLTTFIQHEDVLDLEDELEEAEEEGDEEAAASLRKEIEELKATFDPAEGLKSVEGIKRYLEQNPQILDPEAVGDPERARTVTANLLLDLKAYEAILARMSSQGKRFYLYLG